MICLLNVFVSICPFLDEVKGCYLQWVKVWSSISKVSLKEFPHFCIGNNWMG